MGLGIDLASGSPARAAEPLHMIGAITRATSNIRIRTLIDDIVWSVSFQSELIFVTVNCRIVHPEFHLTNRGECRS